MTAAEMLPQNAANAIEPCLSVADIASKLPLSPRTIRRLFGDEEGVLWLGRPTLLKGHTYKRRYFTLMIPVSVFNRVRDRLQKDKPRPSLAPRQRPARKQRKSR